jgi:hypothetical protein
VSVWIPTLSRPLVITETNTLRDYSAVIGIGSSGLQTIGAITPYTKNVSVFARSKFWVRRDYLHRGPFGKLETYMRFPSPATDQPTFYD